MRIISGKHKGRRIHAPKKLPVRPTKDMAKEGLFNILNHRYSFRQLDVLDLFAGTGSISYEFASRGAQYIVAVDSFYGCVKFIRETAEQFDMPIQSVKSDALAYLKKIETSFDIIFADPPYATDHKEFELMVITVFERGLLKPDGTLIVEHSKHTDLTELKYFEMSRSYGGSVFSFFS